MSDLSKHLSKKIKKMSDSKPLIFDFGQNDDRAHVQLLLENNKIHHVIDDYRTQYAELFAIRNPVYALSSDFKKMFEKDIKKQELQQPLWQRGRWVFFPWISTLVHTLKNSEFQQVRTARNKDLITKKEQDRFFDATIGIAGLSIGNSVALATVLQGGARRLKLADFDVLELSNLNRIRTGIDMLGVPKVEVTARQVYLLNPYAEIELFSKGLTDENIEAFFSGLDVVVDELDDFAMKYRVREYAQKNRIPVVMVADNGDSAVVDIERYDKDPDTPFFHGRIGNTSHEKLRSLDKIGTGRTIAQYIGLENHNERMLSSLKQIGETLVSWPQLGGTALLGGSALAYCIRKILNDQPLKNTREIISFEETLDPTYDTPQAQEKRGKAIEEFKKILQL